jgi:cytochrome c
MSKNLLIVSFITILIATNIGPLHAKNRVDADPDTYEGWYDDRDIEDAPAQVQYGYELILHTPVTLGPDGYVKGTNGDPIVYSTLSCSSCHFDGGRVVEGIPFFQVRDKYAAPGKFWRPKNRVRQIEERIYWCVVNCAYGQMLEED